MAASTNRNLFLQVGADVSPLQASMKAGRTALLGLADAAGNMQEEVQKQLRAVSADPNTLKQMVASYDATFRQIRANAQAALSSNDNQSALKLIDATGAQQAAAAAQAQASQLRVAASAAAAVAERQGEAGVAARVLAAAFEVQADDAAKVAAALNAQAGVMAEVAAEAKILGAREDEVSGSHARMGASGLIAEHVIRSMSDSIAAGQSPVRALTMEMGRITEAMTLFAQQSGATEGAMGKFASFMGGPWGLAISVAVAVLTPLVAELFAAKDAAEAAKLGNDGLADAQGALGKMFDLTSGKLEHQNSLLRLNAQLTAINLRADAAKDRTASAKALGSAGDGVIPNIPGLGAISTLGQLFGLTQGNAAVRSLAQRARVANRLTNDDERGAAFGSILAATEKTDFAKSGITKEAFIDALRSAVEAPVKEKVAGEIDRSLKTGVLDQGLRNDPKTRTTRTRAPKVDRSAEIAANQDRAYQSELNTAQERVAKDQLALSDTAENRLKVELDRLDASKKTRDIEIADQLAAGKFGKATSDKAIAEAATLTKLNAEATDLEKQAATRKAQQDILDRQLTADQRILDRKMALLQLQVGAGNQGTRAQRALALEQLRVEEEGRTLAANRKLASSDTQVQDAGRDELAGISEQHQGRVDQINRDHQNSLESFGTQLHKDTDDMNDALADVEAKGLQGLEDGLLGIISGSESASQAFKKMAASMLADLEKLAIEKAIVSIFGLKTGGVNLGGGGADNLPGFASGIIHGPGDGTSDSILAFMSGKGLIRVSNGESIITASATKANAPWLRAMNQGLKLPGFAVGMVDDANLPAIPTSYPPLPKSEALRTPEQRVAIEGHWQVTASPEFDVKMQGVAARTVGQAAQPIMSGATNQTLKKLRRQSLPGGYS